jgi:hypothetical protein
MIYKFRFEVCTDDNELCSASSEESGNFWEAFNCFLKIVTQFARDKELY